jgi:hypothetical protein
MPAGYDKKRFRAWWRNDGSSNLLHQTEYGQGPSRLVLYDEDSTVLQVTAGSATTPTDVNCAALVPTTSRLIKFLCDFETATDVNVFELRPNGGTNWRVFRIGVALTNLWRFEVDEMPCDASQVVEYQVTAGTDVANMYVTGYWFDV